jgi:hypothetical protein
MNTEAMTILENAVCTHMYTNGAFVYSCVGSREEVVAQNMNL